MKTRKEIELRREDLRDAIAGESTAIKQELLREEIFALDRCLGLFNDGELLPQSQLFVMLQKAQATQAEKVKDWENPREHSEIKIVSSVTAYRWVLSK